MASKSKKKPSKAEESDVDGSEKSFNSNVIDDDDDASMSEAEQFYFDDDNDFGASSTQIQPSDKALNLDDQVELINCLKLMIKPMEYAGTTFQRTLKKIKWEDVKISGYTSEQLKNEFLRSIKPVKKVRTLMEVILDLEENDAKYKRDTHQDYPKKPFSAFMYYQTENRDKLIKGWQKKQADSTKLPTLGALATYASEKFRELPEKKIALYTDRYKIATIEYQEKLESFYVAHPELRVKTASKKKTTSENKLYTPLIFFLDKMKAESTTPLNRNDLLKNWREMSDMEKAPFIKAVAEDYGSLKERRISKEEQKILDSYNGIPVKPMHPFNEFIKDFQKNYSGESKERFREASVTWKNMNSEDKQKYLDLSEAKTEIYRQDLETYVSGLPSKEREETWIKLRLSKRMKMSFNPNDSVVKKQNGSSKDVDKKSDIIKPTAAPSKSIKAVPKAVASAKKEQTDDSSKKVKVVPSPEKFKKFEESDDSSRKRKAVAKVPASPEKSIQSDDSSKKRQKNKLYNESEEEAEAARKKFKTEKEVTTDSDSRGSPKKKKKKEIKMLKPAEYPSQTKQHYFLTHVYKGALDKPEKINAAWLKLNKSEKKKIIDKVAENQKSYLKIVQDFVANNDRQDVEIFKKVAKDCQAEQNKAIAWCKNMNSDSSSDSDDSDSS